MEHDDRPIGRLLSRRQAVALLGAGGAAWLAPWNRMLAQSPGPAGACAVVPELTEGPYFVDEQAMRSDIRVEPASGAVTPGVPLALAFAVSQIAGGRCSPLPGAIVDVWQCDALGEYSAVTDPLFTADTRERTFLRGAQTTAADGAARFTTIYPGWYTGRAVHIHFKIRTPATGTRAYEFTSQLFFPETLTDTVHAREPYAKKGRRDRTNDEDGIYRRGGAQLMLRPAATAEGFDAAFAIALDLGNADVGRPDGGRRGRGRRGAPGPGRRGQG